MEIGIWLNLAATAVTIFWLYRLTKHQRQIISDQSQKLTDLERYINIFRQMNEITSPENVLKLLDTEKRLLQQKNEDFLIEQSKEINKKLLQKRDNELNPKHDLFIDDSLRFIISYFKATEFKSKMDRYNFIKGVFPNNWEAMIVIADKFSDKSSAE